jgi:tripartite-type tricarboxylate transporter receptor subunit TctC
MRKLDKIASCKCFVVAMCGLLMNSPLSAEPKQSPNFKGKTITLVVGSTPGGGYDLTARVLARHFADHLSGHPLIVIQNMPGGGSISAANYLYNVAPQDGTVIAEVQRPVPFSILFDQPGVRFDPSKFQYLGSTTSEIGVAVAWHTAPQKKPQDLFGAPMIVGGNGTATDTELFARAMNRLIGTKFNIVGGYPGQTEIALAMERGEVQGVANWSWNDIPAMHPDWLQGKKISILMQLGLHKVPELPDVPLIDEFAKTGNAKKTIDTMMEMKSLGRPFLIGPNVPGPYVNALRAAFDATMGDAEYRSDVKKSGGSLDPVPGAQMQEMLEQVYTQPRTIIDSARAAMAP